MNKPVKHDEDGFAVCIEKLTEAFKTRDYAGILVHSGHLLSHVGDLVAQFTRPTVGACPCPDPSDCIDECDKFCKEAAAVGSSEMVGLSINPGQLLALIQAIRILLEIFRSK